MVENRIKGAIFDLDGTLLDSLWIWKDIDRKFLAARGFGVPADYMATISTMTYRQAAEYTISRFGLNEQPDSLMSEWSDMAVKYYESGLKLKPRAKEYITSLKSRGVKLAIATSALPEMCAPALSSNGITDMFTAVVTSFEIGRGKEFPDVYLAAANALGLSPKDCAVYEDTLRALQTAKRAGFVTVGVYDKFSHRVVEQMQQEADEFISFD